MQHPVKLGYFNIKVSEKEAKTISFLVKLIIEHWEQKKHSDSKLQNTYIQKVLFEISEKMPQFAFLTRGWYKYGGILVEPETFVIDENITAELLEINDEENVRRSVFKICDEYNPNAESFLEWQKKQYSDYNKPFYTSALEFKEFLSHPEVSTKKECKRAMVNLKNNFPDNELLLDVKDYFDIFISLANYSLEDNSHENREMLIETYNALWNLFATYNLFITVVGDQKKEVQEAIKPTFKGLNIIALNSLLELKNHTLPLIRTQEEKLERAFSKSRLQWEKILKQTNGDVHKASEIYDAIIQTE